MDNETSLLEHLMATPRDQLEALRAAARRVCHTHHRSTAATLERVLEYFTKIASSVGVATIVERHTSSKRGSSAAKDHHDQRPPRPLQQSTSHNTAGATRPITGNPPIIVQSPPRTRSSSSSTADEKPPAQTTKRSPPSPAYDAHDDARQYLAPSEAGVLWHLGSLIHNAMPTLTSWTGGPNRQWGELLTAQAKAAQDARKKCRRQPHSVLKSWEEAAEQLATCRAFPRACSLCAIGYTSKNGIWLRALGKMRSQPTFTNAVARLWLCALIGLVVEWLLICYQAWCRTNHAAQRCEDPTGTPRGCEDPRRCEDPIGTPSGSSRSLAPHCCSAREPQRAFHCLQRLLDRIAEWWSFGPPLIGGSSSGKLLVLVLLSVDLLGINAPEINVLATPEYMELKPTMEDHLSWLHELFVTHALQALQGMGLTMHAVRGILLTSWHLYLVLPSSLDAGRAYALGAVMYFTLGAFALAHCHSHGIQAALLFVIGATAAVPELPSNPRAARWLCNYLLLGVLAPSYLGAGLSKLRYLGWAEQLSGGWLPRLVISAKVFNRATLPDLVTLIAQLPMGFQMMSFGNLLIELFLPALVLILHGSAMYPRLSSLTCVALCLIAFAFHATIFVLMGPNFVQQATLAMLAAASYVYSVSSCLLQRCRRTANAWQLQMNSERRQRADDACAEETDLVAHDASEERADGARPIPTPALPRSFADEPDGGPSLTWTDRARGVTASAVLLSWMAVQLYSDFAHFFGIIPLNHGLEPLWPIPENNMFARPSGQKAAFGFTGLLGSTLCLIVLVRMCVFAPAPGLARAAAKAPTAPLT